MSGARDLKANEVTEVISKLNNTRDKALFILGMKTGFRISELLSFKVGDVYQYGKVVDSVRVERKNMKGRVRSRIVPLHSDAKVALAELAPELKLTDPHAALFQSERTGQGIGYHMARLTLHKAYSAAQLTGQLATHSMRKSFARAMYNRLGKDLIATQHALGHSHPNTTAKYLPPDQEAITRAILE